jgi:glucose-6-phosphate 1-epimerase
LARRITIAKRGSRSTVVWNPWIAKARSMPDFGDDEWRGMVCVETANVVQAAVTIRPGEMHTMSAIISVEGA